jgi:hypothetical protein
MPPDDPAFAAIRDLRQKLADLEAFAAGTPAPASLHDSIADHYSPAQPATDPARRRLVAEGRQFVEDPASEDALVARAKDPAAYDSAMEAMHVSGLPLSLYSRMRAAAVETRQFVPPAKEGASK